MIHAINRITPTTIWLSGENKLTDENSITWLISSLAVKQKVYTVGASNIFFIHVKGLSLLA